MFSAPREVDRELYLTVTESNVTEEDVSDPSRSWYTKNELQQSSLGGQFPAPREVDRELYMIRFQFTDPVPTEFPAPLEVDRDLYNEYFRIRYKPICVSVPSRGR